MARSAPGTDSAKRGALKSCGTSEGVDAILLAGGYGTRLRPLTYTRPKPLVPLAGRPMLEWVLDRLPAEVDHVVLAVNWLAEALERHVRDHPRGIEVTVVREAEPLGTAGAVKNCEAHLRSDALLVLNGDIVSDMDLAALVRLHRVEEGAGVISLKEVPLAEVVQFGVVEPAPGPGCAEVPEAVRIARFVEKPKSPAEAPSRLINAGAYVLDRKVLDLIPPGRLVSMEKEVFPKLIPQGFWGLPFEGAWIDVGDPDRLRQASRHLDPDHVMGPDGRVATTALFEDSLAGRMLLVGSNAVVRRCILGDNVTVRAGVVLEECVVGDRETVDRSARGERIWSREVPLGYPAQQVGNAL